MILNATTDTRPDAFITRDWVFCLAGLALSILFTLLVPADRWEAALLHGGALLLAAISSGLHRPAALAALFVFGAACGFAAPAFFGPFLTGFFTVLFLLLAVLWWNTPFTATIARTGLAYCVRSRPRVMPPLDFAGRRPLMLRQSVLDDLANIADFADRFLTRNGIRYIAVYGTVLGAMRHGGLIPWDDDIDFSIYRPQDLERLEKDFATLAADAARDGFVLFRHGTYWKLAPDNFWRYPTVDLYVKAADPDPQLEPDRIAFEGITLCAAPDRADWITKKYGADALTQAVHGIPFWDSGFVPAFVTRLFGYRILSTVADFIEALFAPRGV